MFCIIFIAEVIAFAVYLITASKKKKAMEEDFEEPKILKTERTLVIIFSVIIMVCTGFIAAIEKAAIYEDWSKFDDERKAEVERTSDIIIDDNIRLKRYIEKFGGPDGPLHELEFECDLDMFEFAEKNCKGYKYVRSYFKDGNLYTIDDEKLENENKIEYIVLEKYDGKFGDQYDEYYSIVGEKHRFTIYKKGDVYSTTYPNWGKIS